MSKGSNHDNGVRRGGLGNDPDTCCRDPLQKPEHRGAVPLLYQSQAGTWNDLLTAWPWPPGYGKFENPLNLMNHDASAREGERATRRQSRTNERMGESSTGALEKKRGLLDGFQRGQDINDQPQGRPQNAFETH